MRDSAYECPFKVFWHSVVLHWVGVLRIHALFGHTAEHRPALQGLTFRRTCLYRGRGAVLGVGNILYPTYGHWGSLPILCDIGDYNPLVVYGRAVALPR